MARLRTLDPTVESQVAEQLGPFMQPAHPVTFGAAEGARWELLEHFPLASIDPRQARDAVRHGVDLSALCHDTGQWHHQVANASGPAGYAQSEVGPDATATVTAYTATADARVLADALENLDRLLPSDDYEAQLLDLRGYGLAALLLIADPRPGPDTPSLAYVYRVVDNVAGLRAGELYESSAFLEALSKLEPIGGLFDDFGQNGPPSGAAPIAPAGSASRFRMR
jgi:hypothetical protein